MPSDDALQQQAEDFKSQGNAAFSKGNLIEAISCYSQGLVACDRVVDAAVIKSLKVTLLSNRAMCHLKDLTTLQDCIDDCTSGLELDPSDTKLRNKILFRRAKARFLQCNLPTSVASSSQQQQQGDALQDAAKDLLQVISSDASNKEANQLLTTIRAQYKSQQATAATPVAKALQALQGCLGEVDEPLNEKDALHQIKLLLGMLDNDLKNTCLELGRHNGVSLLLQTIQQSLVDASDGSKLTILAVQCLSQSASHPAFARDFLVSHQNDLLTIVQNERSSAEVVVMTLAVLVRVILHADRDDPNQDISGNTVLDQDVIWQTIQAALTRRFDDNAAVNEHSPKVVLRAVIDLVGTWTAGTDRDAQIRHSLGTGVFDPTLPVPKTQSEIRAFTPQELAAHRKRQADQNDRDGAWAFGRCILLTSPQHFPTLLHATCQVEDHIVRRELIVMIGRVLAVLDDEDRIKKVVEPYLRSEGDDDGPRIEEVFDEDEKVAAEEEMFVSLEQMMQRAILTCALLLSKKDVGSWALGSAWKSSGDELAALVSSGDNRAMCLASEVVSAAATVEASRHLVSGLISSGAMEALLKSDDRDIRSGAASAVAKLGLSNKEAQKDEGEVMGMLLAACDLLEDDKEESGAAPPSKDESKFRHFSSFATSSVERAVEMISYLIYSTVVKEELAAGFQPRPDSSLTALERLVKTTDLPNAGESLTGFALATIFQNMAATNLQLRKEGFEGKEVTMEQYDEMQKLGKTAEEKEVMESEEDPDTVSLCHERIRKMAAANVPRAMVTLIEGASEHTLEQLITGLNRMANEESVRGVMIQQGVLSACIKLEKNEGPTETDTMKKVIQLARHCIAKMLVTTNPTLLTSAQRLGSVRPLIQLVRDIKSSDLQKFEALLSITNIGGSGEDAQNRIVSEKGIPTLHFAMFSDHEMVRRAATESMSNLVPHQAMMDHLEGDNNLRLWLAFATDYEENYECARAAAGCLAMATQDPTIAEAFIDLEKFRANTEMLLECGRLEIMHRAFVLVYNLVAHGGVTKEQAISEGLVTFCEAYVSNYHNNANDKLEFSEQEQALLPVTVDLAKNIVKLSEEES